MILKTDLANLNNDTWTCTNAIHDVKAAHAYKQAHKDWRAKAFVMEAPIDAVNWIEKRAAELHAKMLAGERV